MKRILSVDWDYFLPDPTPYGWWSHENEYDATLRWCFRAGLQVSKGAPPFFDVFRPSRWRGFFDNVTFDSITVADSHYDIVPLVGREDHVVSFDAHHDVGYLGFLRPDNPVKCGEWVSVCLPARYQLHYPNWRKRSPEGPLSKKVSRYWERINPEVHYGGRPSGHFDKLFLCRSPQWSPPWADRQFNLLAETVGSPGLPPRLAPLREDVMGSLYVIKKH